MKTHYHNGFLFFFKSLTKLQSIAWWDKKAFMTVIISCVFSLLGTGAHTQMLFEHQTV